MSASPAAKASTPSQVGPLLRLAWPAVLSYTLNNAYRLNDQFWIQGLGGKAQAAIAATFFVQVMNFAVVFLAVGGTLALVARATGARDPGLRDSTVRHALGFGLTIGFVLTATILPLIPGIMVLLGLAGETAAFGSDYLGTLYLFFVALVLFPILDAIFIGRGNSRVPMILQCTSVSLNYVLNPILIYGSHAADAVHAPGARILADIAGALGIEGMGIRGAALATGLSRVFSVTLGLAILRYGFGTRLLVPGRPRPRRVADIVRISFPVSFSIAVYAGAYWAIFAFVLTALGDDVRAGLGIGFQVFEGVAFPCYLGVSIGASSLVGRAIGARERDTALEVVHAGRKVARVLGAVFAAAFWIGAPAVIPAFTQDPDVARETLRYVRVLAFSQYWVAVETINEKVLLGSGQTRPILVIAPLGNSLRVPLGWAMAVLGGLGAAGLWWAINLTTYLKAFLFWRRVESGTWLDAALAEQQRTAPEPPAPAVAPR